MTQKHAMRKYHFLIAAAVVALDQLTKWLVAKEIALNDSIPVIPGLFRLTHVQNRGAAFGIFDDSPTQFKIAVLILFSLVAMVVIAALLWKNSHAVSATGVGLALVLGGAIGNLWDRLVNGYVVDFLDVYIRSYHWPAFNVADSAIVVGAFLLMGEILFAGKPKEQPVA